VTRIPAKFAVGRRAGQALVDCERVGDRAHRRGALRLSANDAAQFGLAEGARARVITARGAAKATIEVSVAMLAGDASLPNGLGLAIRYAKAGHVPPLLVQTDGSVEELARRPRTTCRRNARR
jgi:anaerobic selenocysteine-containing dehydrogenase